MKFEKHIFVCTNQRAEGEKKSCGEECGIMLVKAFKKALKENNLKNVMRAQRAGCLDACEYGPSVVVYPEGIYYGGVQLSDVDEIVNEHLMHNHPVKRLISDFTTKKMKPEIEKYKTEQVVLKETAGQLQKDLESCGMEIRFPEADTIPYESLLNQVEFYIEKLLRENVSALQTLLYRVDIPEKNFVHLKSTSEKFAHDLARLILEREFMKVVTRRMYK